MLCVVGQYLPGILKTQPAYLLEVFEDIVQPGLTIVNVVNINIFNLLGKALGDGGIDFRVFFPGIADQNEVTVWIGLEQFGDGRDLAFLW